MRLIDRWGIDAVLGPGPYPVGLLHRLSVVEAAFDTVRKLRESVGAEVHKLTESELERIKYFREEGWL